MLLKVFLSFICLGLHLALDPDCSQSMKMVSGGWRHSLAITLNGSLMSWGNNEFGQLGFTSATPSPPEFVLPGTNWSMVAATYNSSFGIMTNGTLWAFGLNDMGQLGVGTKTYRLSPIQIGNDSDWMMVSSGGYHTLALKLDGSLWGWGSNSFGALGLSVKEVLKPQRLQEESKFIKISAGGRYSLALLQDGTLLSWGNNMWAQLGNDEPARERSKPMVVGTKSAWKDIAAGWTHALALDKTGKLYAWGDNEYGPLGINSTIKQSSPVLVGDQIWTSIAAGEQSSYAINEEGALYAWGRGEDGQLGLDKNMSIVPVPTMVSDTVKFTSVSAGYFFAHTITEGGILLSFGSNRHGQLGEGTKDKTKLWPSPCAGSLVCHQNSCIQRCPTNGYVAALGLCLPAKHKAVQKKSPFYAMILTGKEEVKNLLKGLLKHY